MRRGEPFEFSDQPVSNLPLDSHVVRIVGDVRGKDGLLRALYECLELPGYFGFNWDALSECLRDLDWLDSDSVVLVHDVLPVLSKSELRTYVEVLAEAIESWEADDSRSLRVVFPEAVREVVASALVAR